MPGVIRVNHRAGGDIVDPWTPFVDRVRRFLLLEGRYPWVSWSQSRGGAEKSATGHCRSALEYVMSGTDMTGVSIGFYDIAWEKHPSFDTSLYHPTINQRFARESIPVQFCVGESIVYPVKGDWVTRGNATHHLTTALSATMTVHSLTGPTVGAYVVGHWANGDKTVLFISGEGGGSGFPGLPLTPNGGDVTFTWGASRIVLNVKVE